MKEPKADLDFAELAAVTSKHALSAGETVKHISVKPNLPMWAPMR